MKYLKIFVDFNYYCELLFNHQLRKIKIIKIKYENKKMQKSDVKFEK